MIHTVVAMRIAALACAPSASARRSPNVWRGDAGRLTSACASNAMASPTTSAARCAASASRASEPNAIPPAISATM